MISRCPQCGREVAIPPGVVAEAVVRCPICSAEYPLADALSQLPPLLIVVDPVLAVAESDAAADVTSVQSAATAEEVALLAQQPAAEAIGGAGTEADLFAPSDEATADTIGEAAGIATGEAEESAEGDLFEDAATDAEAATVGEAVATDQAEGVAEEEAVEEGEFGLAGEEGEEDAESAGATALADFARLQESKAEPSTAAKLRRKKGKNPVWQLGGVIGGAVIGLFLGYYVLNFFWGAQHDYLGIWLPGCPHTAKHRPTWLGGDAAAETNGSSQNGTKRNSAAKNSSERRQRGDQQNGKPSGQPGDSSKADAASGNGGTSSDTAAPSSDDSPAMSGNDSPETKPRDSSPSSASVDDATKPSAPAGEPTLDPPSLDVPSLDMPKLDLPKIDSPKIDAPKIDAPTVDAPTIDAPKLDMPKAGTPSGDAPSIDPPSIDPPSVDPPSVSPPKLADLMPNAPSVDRPTIDEPKLDMPAPAEPKLEPFGPEPSKSGEKPGEMPGKEPGDEPKGLPEDKAPSVPSEQPGSGEPAAMPADPSANEKPAEEKPVASPPTDSVVRPDASAPPEKTDLLKAPIVGWKNPPRASATELQSSLSDAWKVFGCRECNAIGVVRVDGREQPCPACQGKPPAEITAEVYEKLAVAAARSIHIGSDDPETRDAALAQTDQFFRQVVRLGGADQLGRQAAERLQSAEGPRGGIVLACVMGREFAKEGLFGATVETLGQPHRVGVFSNRSLGVAPGKKVILLGDVMVNPSENLAGATLNKPWIIWVGRVIEIDDAVDQSQ